MGGDSGSDGQGLKSLYGMTPDQNPTTPTPTVDPNMPGGGIQGYTTMPPFMPGFDQAIAQQLAQGYGQQPQDFLDYFKQLYSPIRMPAYDKSTPGITPLPKGENTEKSPVTKGSKDFFNLLKDPKNIKVVRDTR